MGVPQGQLPGLEQPPTHREWREILHLNRR
jgi:hypothetical protein